MRFLKSFPFLLIIVLFTSLNASAQKGSKKEADIAFKSEEYFSAIELYKKAFSKEKNKNKKADIILSIAHCYRMLSNSKQAETWYLKAIKGTKDPDPIAYLYLADAKKANGNYAEALVEYNKYQSLVPDDPRGDMGAKSCEQSQKWKDKPTRHKVDNMAMLNSKSSDFSPVYAKKDYKVLIFTSTREGSTGKDADVITGESYSDLYKSIQDKKGKWSIPAPLGVTVNSPLNEGSAAVNTKGTTLYFTRCNIKKNAIMGCQILYSKSKGLDWDEPAIIDLCSDSFTVGHPTISADEKTMYISADLSGGYGGKDIWKVEFNKKTKTWGKPVNVGKPINTEGDEMFPYIHPDGRLFFSSNYHAGMGGLDIFYSEKSGDNWGEPVNMQYPVNSAGDDFGIIFENKATTERGFFTSNREGGKGGDDIYSFIIPPLVFTIQGIVTDVDKGNTLSGAKIIMVGTDGTAFETTTDKDGSYTFKLNSNTSYTLTANKDQYLSDKGQQTTVGLEESKALELSFQLKAIAKPIILPNIEYDLAKWDLRPESFVSLDTLLITLNDNPNITIEIGSHTDSRDNDNENLILSGKRALSVVNYLLSKGIAADRLTAKGYGEKKLLVSDAEIKKMKTPEEKEAAHQKNRRTDFRVIRTDYVPKDGLPNSGIKPVVQVIDATNEGGEEEEIIIEEEDMESEEEEAPQQQTPPNNPETPKTTPKN